MSKINFSITEMPFLTLEYAAPFYYKDILWQNAQQCVSYNMLRTKGMDKKQIQANNSLQDKILGAYDPFKCRYFLSNKGLAANNAVLRLDAEEAFSKVLRAVIKNKFSQNPVLLSLLLDTKGQLLHDNPYDEKLGTGRNGKGENLLGKTLTKFKEDTLTTLGIESYDPSGDNFNSMFNYCLEFTLSLKK